MNSLSPPYPKPNIINFINFLIFNNKGYRNLAEISAHKVGENTKPLWAASFGPWILCSDSSSRDQSLGCEKLNDSLCYVIIQENVTLTVMCPWPEIFEDIEFSWLSSHSWYMKVIVSSGWGLGNGDTSVHRMSWVDSVPILIAFWQVLYKYAI